MNYKVLDYPTSKPSLKTQEEDGLSSLAWEKVEAATKASTKAHTARSSDNLESLHLPFSHTGDEQLVDVVFKRCFKWLLERAFKVSISIPLNPMWTFLRFEFFLRRP